LPCLGEQLLGLEPFADLSAEAEPVETAGRENDRVETALMPLPQARVDIAPQRLDREVGLERVQLRAPAHRGGADAHAGAELAGAAQGVARIITLEVRTYGEAFGIRGRHVLGRVHGDVHATCEERLFELLHEDAARA